VSDLAARVTDLEREVAELRDLLLADNPRRSYMLDVIRFKLPKVLVDLQQKHPHGVTAKHVADHFGYPIETTQAAIKRLTDAGKIRRHKRPRERAAVLLLPGQEPAPERRTPPAQMKLLHDLIRISDRGTLEKSISRISLEIGTNANTLHYRLHSLVADGHMKILKRGAAGKPSRYFIPRAIQ
jgi:DNA-binding MarR family transcriptional regulator